jgi:hypothetical protein
LGLPKLALASNQYKTEEGDVPFSGICGNAGIHHWKDAKISRPSIKVISQVSDLSRLGKLIPTLMTFRHR